MKLEPTAPCHLARLLSAAWMALGGECLQNRVELITPPSLFVHSFSISEYFLCTRTESGAGDTMLKRTVPDLKKLSVPLLNFQGLLHPHEKPCNCCHKTLWLPHSSMHMLDYRIGPRCLLWTKYGARDKVPNGGERVTLKDSIWWISIQMKILACCEICSKTRNSK